MYYHFKYLILKSFLKDKPIANQSIQFEFNLIKLNDITLQLKLETKNSYKYLCYLNYLKNQDMTFSCYFCLLQF